MGMVCACLGARKNYMAGVWETIAIDAVIECQIGMEQLYGINPGVERGGSALLLLLTTTLSLSLSHVCSLRVCAVLDGPSV